LVIDVLPYAAVAGIGLAITIAGALGQLWH
jgi:hypothetical protein